MSTLSHPSYDYQHSRYGRHGNRQLGMSDEQFFAAIEDITYEAPANQLEYRGLDGHPAYLEPSDEAIAALQAEQSAVEFELARADDSIRCDLTAAYAYLSARFPTACVMVTRSMVAHSMGCEAGFNAFIGDAFGRGDTLSEAVSMAIAKATATQAA